jgi:hypothetical protein
MEEVFVPVTASHHPKFEGLFRRVVIIFVVINLLLLDLLFLQSFTASQTTKPQKEEEESPVTAAGCDETCLDEVKKAVADFAESVVPSEEAVTVVGTKEYFVPLGSGVNTTDEWTDVNGASAYVDTANYSAIKEVIFEASIRIPNANQDVYVRLYNATDKHPVWFSEMTTSAQSQLLRSGAINLDEGNKLYTVQMKSQLKGTTLLDQARVKITTN